MDAARLDEVPRPQLAEAGLFLLLVAAPLAFAPFTASPFADVKLPFVLGGAALLWFSGVAVDRTIGLLAAAWVVVTFAAAILGVDPSRGLTAQSELEGSGAMVVCAAAVFAAVAGSLPKALQHRVITFSIATGVAVGFVGLVYRFFPTLTDPVLPPQGLRGSTLGNPLFAAAIVTVAIACVIGADRGPLGRQLLVVVFLTAASASFGERLTLVLPIVAAIVAAWRSRRGRRDAVAFAATVLLVLVVWLALEPALPRAGGEGTRSQLGGVSESDSGRLQAWRGATEGWLERPLTGWGPGSTNSAFIRGSSPQALEDAGREWADAHNLILETLVTTGPFATVPMVAILTLCAIRGFRRGAVAGWALGSAAALGTFALLQPVSLILTPLLFLFAGAASGARAPIRPRATIRGIVGATLSVALIGSLVLLAASTFERWGTRYGEVWALETSLDLQPWRISAQRELALRLSVDASAGDEAAAVRARDVVGDAVRAHPWDPDVRLWAADVEHLIGDDDAAVAWVEQHVARFPADAGILDDVRRSLAEGGGFSIPSEATGDDVTSP